MGQEKKKELVCSMVKVSKTIIKITLIETLNS
jgi:hypothetical protein